MNGLKKLRKIGVALTFFGVVFISGNATADTVIPDDLIVNGSACIGFDCVNGENFGFDTLRLKENNLRIHFEDTSSSASFPPNDWRIIINDTSNGGLNHFSVEDSTAGRMIFRIEAGAPANSLYVDDGGRVGIGTATPVVELHVRDGDTPTLRLEQDGSSGFTPQTWDVAGNETNFFIRDATNGSRLVFRIRPNAPSDSIHVAADGKVGLGTASPNSALDVVRSGNQTTVDLGLRNGSSDWRLQNFQDDFRITLAGTGNAELTSKANGNLVLNGTCIEFDTGGTPFQCTFSAGGPACAVGACP